MIPSKEEIASLPHYYDCDNIVEGGYARKSWGKAPDSLVRIIKKTKGNSENIYSVTYAFVGPDGTLSTIGYAFTAVKHKNDIYDKGYCWIEQAIIPVPIAAEQPIN